MQKSINAADVDKRAVSMRLRTVPLTRRLLEWRVTCPFARARLFLKNDATIDDDIFISDIELGNAAGDLRCRPGSPSPLHRARRCGWRA